MNVSDMRFLQSIVQMRMAQDEYDANPTPETEKMKKHWEKRCDGFMLRRDVKRRVEEEESIIE